MGLRSPQDTLRPPSQQAVRTPEFRANPRAGQIDPTFLNILQEGNNERKRQLERQRQEELRRLEKQREQKQRFMDAVFGNEADRIRLEAEAELSNARGANALEAGPSIRQKYLDRLKESLQGMPQDYRNDPRSQMSFVKKVGQFQSFAIPYVNTQARQVEDEAFKSRIANDMNTVVENATDLDYIEREGIPTVEAAIHERLVRQYGDDPNRQIGNTTAGQLIMSEMQAGVSDTIRKSVVQQVMLGDFQTAGQTIERFYDRITPDDRVKIKKIIDDGLKKNRSDRALDLVSLAWETQGEENMPLIERFITANAGGDSELRNKALAIAQSRYRIQEQAKEDREERLVSELYNEVASGRPMDDAKFRELSPARQDSLINLLQKNNGRRPVVTDQNKLNEIIQQWERMPPEDVVKINVDARYAPYLNASDIGALKTKQEYLRRDIRGEWREGQKWNDSVWKTAADNFIDANRSVIGSRDEAARIRNMAMQEYSRIMQENPRMDRHQQRLELKKALWERAIVEVEDPGPIDRFFDWLGEKTGIEAISEFTTPGTRTGIAETLAPIRPGALHPSWVRAVQEDQIRTNGRELSEPELIRFFQRFVEQNPHRDLSQPIE